MTNKNADSSQVSGGNNAPPPGAPSPAPGENAQPDQDISHAGNKVYKSGPLFLSSRGIGWTSWKKRWFILTSTSLVFFRNDPNVVPPKGSEANLTLGGIDLNSSGSVVVKADKKLLTVLFPDGRDGRAFTLKAETSEDLTEWKEALEEALKNAPSAANGIGQNGVLKNDQPDAVDAPTEQSKNKQTPKNLVTGRPILLALEDIDGTPSFLEKALRFLEEHGVKVEGILRQAADVEDVERQIREFEQGKKEFSPNDDAHVIADCIKYILRELPSSPVPASCCTALLEASRADRSKRIAAMRAAICETFPEPNRRLLQRILTMMKTVVSHKAVNRMSTSAVAACMAPLLLRPLLAGECDLEHDFDMGGDSSVQLMQAAAAANHAQAIVITLLEEYNKFFGEGSMSSGLYSDLEESGSESEELSDDESFEDDEEDDGTEGSYSESYEGSEHASSGSCTGTGDSEDNISEEKDAKSPKVDDISEPDLKQSADTPQHPTGKHDVEGSEHILSHSNSGSQIHANVSGEQSHEFIQESSPNHELTNKSAPTCTQKSATLPNGPGRSKRAAHWGRTPGKKNLSMESIDISPEDMAEVERLEVSRAELQNKIEEEEKANAVLYENLKKHKISLHEQRLTLEQDVARLHEQLQKERDLRAALEAGLEVPEGASSTDDKVKAELEDIAVAKTDVINLRQKADDLTSQLNQQSEQNCCMMSDRPHLCEQSSNHQDKLKDRHKDAAASTKRSEKSTRNKDQSNRADAEKDVKQSDPVHTSKSVGSKADHEKDTKHEHKSTNAHAAQSDSVRSSKYSGYPPTSPSNDSATGKRQGSRGEGATSSNNALSKLTNRLNFLKEKRTQITSEVQNYDKGRSQGQPAQNSEGHSSEEFRGSDHIVQNSDKGVSTEGSFSQNTDRNRRLDSQGGPNLERGKSENLDKGRNVAPSRTLSR